MALGYLAARCSGCCGRGVTPRWAAAAASSATRWRSRTARRSPLAAAACWPPSGRASSSSSWPLPEVPSAVQDKVGRVLAQQLVPREATLVASQQEVEALVPELLSERCLGIDCEGVALGRWGRLCVCQVATTRRVYIFDALGEGVVEALRPVLACSRAVKVMHDCREDLSAFLSQFNLTLECIFDSQVAHTMLLEQQATRPFQISLNELLKSKLQLQNEKQAPLGVQMKDDPNVWFYRPMHEDLLNYAAQDVMYLPLLNRLLCDELGDPSGGSVLKRSLRYAEYARLNLHLRSPKAVEKRGLRLQAMLATRTEAALYFKLNLGAHRQGAVSRPEAISRFRNLQFGDTADCWVSAWNPKGDIIFLERLEPATQPPPPEPHERPRGLWGHRSRRKPIS